MAGSYVEVRPAEGTRICSLIVMMCRFIYHWVVAESNICSWHNCIIHERPSSTHLRQSSPDNGRSLGSTAARHAIRCMPSLGSCGPSRSRSMPDDWQPQSQMLLKTLPSRRKGRCTLVSWSAYCFSSQVAPCPKAPRDHLLSACHIHS